MIKCHTIRKMNTWKMKYLVTSITQLTTTKEIPEYLSAFIVICLD